MHSPFGAFCLLLETIHAKCWQGKEITMTRYQFLLTDSLEKVLPWQAPEKMPEKKIKLFHNQRWSCQLAYTCENDDFGETPTLFRLDCQGNDLGALFLRQVELVPCAYPCHGTWDDNYLTTRPGLLPDLLHPVSWEDSFKAIPAQWRSLWLTLDCRMLPVGQHRFVLLVTDEQRNLLAQFTLEAEISPLELPRQRLYQTQWFHADCLADYYGVSVFSPEHWRIIENFIKSASDHGINMLLTPVFTPPLDTEKGGERTAVQLVDIFWDGSDYTFDFSRLQRWVGLCQKYGITEIEMAHLFSQWGAVAAPNILVHTNQGLEKRFGWHTPAVGGEYTNFLHRFLPELKAELDRLIGLEHVWFHISDEPHDIEKSTYAAAKATVAPLLKGCRVMDALSSYQVYEEGIVEKPVVCNDHIQTFVDHGVQNLWTYYCTVQAQTVPNRFIAMPSARNRIMGALLFQYNIEGFLHWGFNFYNSQRSVFHIDPFRVTDAGEAFPSGDPFLVYPAPDGTAWESIRGEVWKEGLQDLRLLQLCENHKGRAWTLNLLNTLGGTLRFDEYPREKSFFCRLWDAVWETLSS